LPLIDGGASQIRDAVISAESTRQASLAIRTLDWKCILPISEDAQGRPLPDFYGQPRRPEPLLFDLQRDPCEEANVAAEHPQVLAELLGRLAAWRAEMARITGEPDPIQAQGLSLSYDTFMHRLLARR